MALYKRGEIWFYRFMWKGKLVRKSTKQGNKRVAEQIEAAQRTALAKGEAGLRDQVQAPVLRAFADREFIPFVESRFKDKPKTLE